MPEPQVPTPPPPGGGPLDAPAVSLAPFWSVFEIVGIVAMLAPFVIRMSSSSLQTENGHITHFVYRDWVAVIGGIVAILCGLGAAARFRGTLPAKRGLRITVVLLLLGVGVYQVLRGFGVAEPPDPTEFSNDPVTFHRTPDDPMTRAPATPPIDLEPATRAVFDRWQAQEFHELYAMSSKEAMKAASEEDLANLLEVTTAAVGPCAPWTPPARYEAVDDGYWQSAAVVQCGAFHISFVVTFDVSGSTPVVEGLNIKDAEPKQPADADAVALGKRVADQLVAGDVRHWAEDFDPRLLHNLGDLDQTRAQLKKVLAAAGRVSAVELVESKPSEGEHEFVFDVAAKTHHLTITVTTNYLVTRWFVTAFNMEPAAKK